MKQIWILVCCLYFMPLLASANTGTQEKDSGQFDRRTALDISQAAIGRVVSDHVLTDSQGVQRKLSEFRGKPLVISLIYTSCFHICPNTTKHLLKVVKKAEKVLGENSFNVISIGFDTPNDTPEAMRYFANKQGVVKENWHFMATSKDSVEALIKDLGFQYFTAPHGFDHLIQSSVLDAQGKVYRQVYGVMFDTPHLIEPLKELVFGEEPKSSLFDQISNRVRLFCTVYDPASDSYNFNYSIFIGLAMGLGFAVIFSYLLWREWRYSNAARERKLKLKRTETNS